MIVPTIRTRITPATVTPITDPKQAVDPLIVRMDSVQPQSVRWIWPGYIPLGMPTIIEGDPGKGKSTAVLDLGARLSAGLPMPDGSRPAVNSKRGVLILSAEDDPACTIRPRLDAAKADCTRVAMLAGVRANDGERMACITDLDAIRAAVGTVDAALVIVDPITAYMGRADTHRDADVRARLSPLIKLAAELSFALVIVRHLKKSSSETNATYRGGGSIGFIGAARVGMLVAPDPEDDTGERRILAPHKSNVARLAPSMAFRIETIEAPSVGPVPVIQWEGTSLTGANELLRAQARSSDDTEPTRLDEAKTFLRATLSAGPLPTTTVLREAKGQGISEKTLRRAQVALAVVAARDGQRWTWRMPVDQRSDADESPDATEDGQANIANGPDAAWPPSNGPESPSSGAPSEHDGQRIAADHHAHAGTLSAPPSNDEVGVS